MVLKRTIPLIIAFLCGAWFAIQYFVPTDLSNQTLTWGSNWVKILYGFAFILGLYSLCHLHLTRIRRRVPGYGYSMLVYAGLAVTLFLGVIGEVQAALSMVFGDLTFANFQSYDLERYTFSSGFTWMFNYFYLPSSATMFSLLAFFIASAAYRTFRAHSVEAACLLAAATIVMLGQVPLSALVSEWIPTLADLIMMYPNMAAKRGILLGVSLGIVATALRIIFGIERAYLGGD
ncbi:hypothetical protein ACFL59_07395 [Planctomycetota bacterium]